jgi:hypothetical protein
VGISRLVGFELFEGKPFDEADQIVCPEDIGVVVQHHAATTWIQLDLLNPWLIAQKNLTCP